MCSTFYLRKNQEKARAIVMEGPSEYRLTSLRKGCPYRDIGNKKFRRHRFHLLAFQEKEMPRKECNKVEEKLIDSSITVFLPHRFAARWSASKILRCTSCSSLCILSNLFRLEPFRDSPFKNGALGRIRTSDPLVRSLILNV